MKMALIEITQLGKLLLTKRRHFVSFVNTTTCDPNARNYDYLSSVTKLLYL